MARVSIIMGSDSDLSTMAKAAKVLEEFAVDYEMRIFSAHRTPVELADYVTKLKDSDCEVIIAGAGKAAALPGDISARTIIPVIGVPMPTSDLGGRDSLYSMLQMPTGVVVATVAIGGAANAALLAVQMMATHDKALADKIYERRSQQARETIAKDDDLQRYGYEEYLAKHKT